MDDVSKNKENNNTVDTGKLSSTLQNSEPKSEHLKNNSEMNGAYERSTPLLTPPSPLFDDALLSPRPLSARAQLEPISPENYFIKEHRRASMNGSIAWPCSRSQTNGEVFTSCVASCARALVTDRFRDVPENRTGDENDPVVREFTSSCAEALKSMRNSFREKTVSRAWLRRSLRASTKQGQ